MRRRPIRTAAFVIAALTVAASARAQDTLGALVGRNVAAVRVEIEGAAVTSPALLDLVALKPGAPFRLEDARTTIARLDGTGRFEDVQMRYTETPAGLEIVFDAIPKHPVDQVVFEGDPVLPRADLARFVRERFGTRLSTVRSEVVAEAVKSLVADEGYVNAKVTAKALPDHAAERAVLHVEIQAGTRAVIGEVTVNATPPLSTEEVISRMAAQAGQPYRERALRSSLRAIRDSLRADGYYEAFANLQPPRPSADGTKVDLTVTVDAGPKVEIRWEGDPKPRGNEEDLVPIKRQASADLDLLDDADRDIHRALWRDGYWKAVVTHTRELDESANILVITFTVKRGPRYRIDRVDVAGNQSLTRAVVDEQLKLKRGTIFRRQDLDAGIARTTAAYLARGFHDVKIEAPLTETTRPRPTEAGVAVSIQITEGPEARVTAIEFPGASRIPPSDLQASMVSKVGAPYVGSNVGLDQAVLLTRYYDLGFLDATVRVEPKFSADRRAVTLVATVSEGPQVIVSDITVIGWRRVSRQLILDEMTLKVGRPLGLAARQESLDRLYALGGFRRVDITAQPRLGGETDVRVVVSVEEAPATTFAFGGGLVGGTRTRAIDTEGRVEDRVEFAPRGSFEIGRRNLGGRNRSINFFSRISLRPQDAPLDPTRDGKGIGFSEYRVTSTFQERGAFRSPTDLLVGFTSEQALRTSFNFVRQSASAEALRRLGPSVSLSGRYALDFTELFDERFGENDPDQPLIDRRFPQVRLSIFSTGLSWDRRNSPLTPTRGTLISGDIEVASRKLGSEVGYAKTFITGSAFRSLIESNKVIVAARAQVGVARGFERTVTTVDADGQPQTDIVADLPASQRLFAGGASTVRGFDVDRLGVAEILNPRSGLSNGGNGLIVLNLELRTSPGRLFGRQFGLVGFVDGGNVFAKAGDMDLGKLRGAVGFGVRYDSPLGPIRLDFGFKMDRHVVAGKRERGWAWHLSFGEAF